jgi:hypothetical protein
MSRWLYLVGFFCVQPPSPPPPKGTWWKGVKYMLIFYSSVFVNKCFRLPFTSETHCTCSMVFSLMWGSTVALDIKYLVSEAQLQSKDILMGFVVGSESAFFANTSSVFLCHSSFDWWSTRCLLDRAYLPVRCQNLGPWLPARGLSPSKKQVLMPVSDYSVLSELSTPDDGGSNHLWNVGKLLPDYMAQHPRRSHLDISLSCFM